ncbi:hypothetical protein QN239_10405 [Mycolicibacterium sp. Y3]
MNATIASTDPESKSQAVWVAMNANYACRGLPKAAPERVECQHALAYYRAKKAIAAESGQLTGAAVDRLRAALAEAVAR